MTADITGDNRNHVNKCMHFGIAKFLVKKETY